MGVRTVSIFLVRRVSQAGRFGVADLLPFVALFVLTLRCQLLERTEFRFAGSGVRLCFSRCFAFPTSVLPIVGDE